MNITQLRTKIDEIDMELMNLFERRMLLVKNVAQYKKENNLPIFDPTRERVLIDKNLACISTQDIRPYALEWIKTMLKVSKEYQENE